MFPEVVDWPTLEGENEEETEAVCLYSDESCPEDDAVGSLDCDSEQKDTDAALQEDIGHNVCWLAGPPPLCAVDIVRWRRHPYTLACTILDSKQSQGTENKERNEREDRKVVVGGEILNEDKLAVTTKANQKCTYRNKEP